MKIILVAGARPNFMKIAPILRAIEKHNASESKNSIEPVLVHTGQHYDYEMSKIFFQDLELPEPDIHLSVGSGTHAEQTGKVLIEFEKVLIEKKPDLVLVVGDVNSTLAAALAAVKLHIQVAHIEAGIRSNDKNMPEEINRLLTDHISNYLFTTSSYDDDNLLKEGIPSDKIFRVGNIMVDSLLHCRDMAAHRDTLSRLGLEKKGYALLTLHRPSNVDDEQNLTRILTAVREIAQKIPVVFPAHPRTQKRFHAFNINVQSPVANHQLLITDPHGYLDFLNLEMNAKMVITDSGGIQVETTVLDIPCLTVMDYPVWHITHEQGINILVGNDSQRLIQEAFKILKSKSDSQSKSYPQSPKRPELWDGKTAERIMRILAGQPLGAIQNSV
jgi:UDP-N-acetylglucosamine 2-epimerase (non-hydrolysing)